MSNTLLTAVQITKEALRILHNNLVFVKGVNRQYSKEFAVTGAKIGNTINVRKPNRYFVRKGAAMQTQGTNETYVPLTLDTQWGVDISFSSAELTLSLDDFSQRILVPAMARIAGQIDQDGLAQSLNVWNVVGTPGTTPGKSGGSAGTISDCSAPICYLNAGMMMDLSAAPRDENRRIVINPVAMAQSVSALSGLYNDQGSIGDQYRKGVLGKALGFEFAMDQNINTLTCGTRVASGVTTVQATSAGAGETTMALTGGSTTIVKGDVFTVANVYGVNPENQMSTGQLQQFVVTEAVTLSGTTTVKVMPPIKLTGATVADGTVTRVPTASDAVVFLGAASTVTPMNLAYHRDAFTLGTADMEIPGGCDFAARQTYDGISMKIVRQYDINTDQLPCRLDVLGGWATLRPELACRIAG